MNQNLAVALNRIGGNLNQVARAVNAERLTEWREQDRALLVELNQQLDATWKALQALNRGTPFEEPPTESENEPGRQVA